MGVKFLAQGNNGLPLTNFEAMQLAILRLLVRRVNNSATPLPFGLIKLSAHMFHVIVQAVIDLFCHMSASQLPIYYFKDVYMIYINILGKDYHP